ncbi:Oidioi.mRNA.OKI2018_I69.PAR.g12034.t1.cds [Oikopleura dioica]|uniref:Oidioi.mRNA.OKI2018_I69.PAR.g12034.t1.cds n=1 Tax=Oikopleura dioica TaxID=34765 RepID=A0ABN7S1K6_OIKDI|nr:Oidioi.mRNA.OKI2018_I69.PAR.g12034.t1.cds [Oikopleura dioica]
MYTDRARILALTRQPHKKDGEGYARGETRYGRGHKNVKIFAQKKAKTSPSSCGSLPTDNPPGPSPGEETPASSNASVEVESKGGNPRKRKRSGDLEDPEWMPNADDESNLMNTANMSSASSSSPSIQEITRPAGTRCVIYATIVENNGTKRTHKGNNVNLNSEILLNCVYSQCDGQHSAKILKQTMLESYLPTPRGSNPEVDPPSSGRKRLRLNDHEDVFNRNNYKIVSSRPHTDACNMYHQGIPDLEPALEQIRKQ